MAPYKPKPNQPQYRVKLACPKCGSVVYVTRISVQRSGGYPTCADGTQYLPAAHRAYPATRRTMGDAGQVA